MLGSIYLASFLFGFLIYLFSCFPYICCQDKAEVYNLIAPFASGIVGLMGSLVGDWTKLQGKTRAEMSKQYCDVAKKIISGVASPSGPTPTAPAPRATRASTSRMKGGHTSLPDDTEFSLPDDTDLLGDNSDTDHSSSDGDDFVDRYMRAPREVKGVRGVKSVRADELIVSQAEVYQPFGGVDPVSPHGDCGHSSGGDDLGVDPVVSHTERSEPLVGDDAVAAHTEVLRSEDVDEPLVAHVVPGSSGVLPSQIPLTAAASVAVEETSVSEESAPSNGITSQARARVISANLVSSLNEGSKVPAVIDVRPDPGLCVYKAGKKKRTLLTVGQKDIAIKAIVVQELAKELSVTEEMMLSVLPEMPKGPNAPKKQSPKR